MRGGLALLIVIGLVIALGGTAAGGGPEPAKTTVKIKRDDTTPQGPRSQARRNVEDHFIGVVRSPKARCEKGRKVKLIDQNADDDNPDGPEVVGQATTNASGRFEIVLSGKPEPDLYRARAARTVKGNQVCRSGRSAAYFFYRF